MHQEEIGWKTTDGIQLYGQEWAPDGEARGVVALVHGLGEHIGRYQHVAEAFTRAGLAMLGVDLPGHGRSEGTRGHTSFDAVIPEITRLLDEASSRYPGKPRFLYGHSMGGAMVLYYGLKCRPHIQGIMCTSPGLATGVPVPAIKLLLARVMARIAPSFTMDNGLDANNLAHAPELVKTYQNDPLVHPRISARLGLDLLTQGQWMIQHAGEFPVPLLLVQGAKDHIVSPKATQAFAEAAPRGLTTYKVWEDAYHETHNDEGKEQAIQYMIQWLEKQMAA
jgi:alpha-beta hydrolase superfamily lysophospholipase